MDTLKESEQWATVEVPDCTNQALNATVGAVLEMVINFVKVDEGGDEKFTH